MSGASGLEIERKYLLAGAPAAADLAALGARPVTIAQVYLRAEDDWVRRVRRVDDGATVRHILTRKRDVAGIVRQELEAELTAEEYGRLQADADPARRVIRKTRHVIQHGDWTLELDVFDDPPGLVLLEVELDDASAVPELPPAIAALVVREVSTEPAYANYALALRPDAQAAPEGIDGDPPDDLPPAEAARARRRDRDAAAAERSGMRTGLAKQFKQVLDAQVKRAREPRDPPAGRQGREAPDDTEAPERRSLKRPWRRHGQP
jgi:CYTH domain-containing protein